MEAIIAKAKRIKLLVLDVDGVLTDGQIYYLSGTTATTTTTAIEGKGFNSQDGLGIHMLQKTGVQCAIITKRQSDLVARRARELGIQHIYQGSHNKLGTLYALTAALAIDLMDVSFIGDDLPDLAVMRRCGLGVAVANAHSFVKQHAHWQTEKSGGNGAVREVCDFIMHAQGTLNALQETYL